MKQGTLSHPAPVGSGKRRLMPAGLSIQAVVLAVFLATVPAAPAAARGAPESFADLAAQLSPTVVNIYTTQTVKTQPHQFMFPDLENLPEPFRRFFSPPGMEGLPQREFKRNSLGSGVITSADGYILTNNHVVEDADEINVILNNYEEYPATVVGRDPKSDVALIKIAPKQQLPNVTFGDSDELRVGDWVLAIGNPFGLEQTVTAGIVSAKSRSIGNETYGNFIQTDASINPGNSGGPLFNLQGEMVGLNTAIFSRTGGNIGIGFAIPINMAKNVMEQLREHGQVTRGWLGVLIQQVSPDLARNFGLERPTGALVGQVTPGSPADKAGIVQGDVIISFQGKEILQMSMLPAMVAQTPVGTETAVGIIRDGKKMEISVTIAKMEEEEGAEEAGSPAARPDKELGLTVQNLTRELAESLGLDTTEGVIISNVTPDTPAAEVGLQRGDLILEVNRRKVVSLQEYAEIVREAKKQDSILLLVKRDGHTRFVVLKIK